MKRILPLALLAIMALSCSPSAVQVQARVADVTARVANAASQPMLEEYRRQQETARDTACGNATPCADPDAARDAVIHVRAQWTPVFAAWTMLRIAHDTYATQLELCQTTDAGCSPNVARLLGDVMRHQTDFRCALVAVGVHDPFQGTLTCSGDRTERDNDNE